MTTFNFSGFATADLFGSHAIRSHLEFTMPEVATLNISVTDDDTSLSGDAHRNERGDDTSGQHATILRDGAEVGNGGRLYAENVWHVSGDDGETYQLVELEQPGHLPDSFTFLGQVPPAGVTLVVQGAANVSGAGLPYGDLSAGALPTPTPNIVDIATGSDDFNILVKALVAADLVGAVQGSDDITVFAPTDAAFTQLATDLGFDGDVTDEDAVFGFIATALAGLAPDGDPIPLLTDILLYHVSPGAKAAQEVDAASEIATLLTGATFGSEGSELVDNEPDVDNPNIVIPNIEASNGTIQVIDRVLLPIDIPGNTIEPDPDPLPTLAAIVAASGGVFDQDGTDFDLLLNAVTAAGLAGALDDPNADLTVFAPNDAAFVGLSQALGFDGTDEGEAFAYLVEALTLLSGGGDPIPLLTEVLTYHVAPTALDSTAVLASDGIATLQGGTLTVEGTSLVDADPDVANPNLIATDIQAANGIAHVLDGVLLPADLLQSDGSNDVDFIIDSDQSSFIVTGQDNDFVDGKGGNDIISLGRGDDVGLGGDGRDILSGGRGQDLLDGGEGNDLVKGHRGDDDLSGGTGNDALFGGYGDDLMNGGKGHDYLSGGIQDDVLKGHHGRDILDGGFGHDDLFGGNGNDRMFGGHGHDRLEGGAGDDVMSGGRGEDTFVFNTGDGVDTIYRFQSGEDMIDLSGTIADSVNDLQISVQGRETVIEISEDQMIVLKGNHHDLGADDFLF